MKKFLVLVLFIVIMAGCTGRQVKDGTARDTLFSVEQTRSGAWGIFLTHDDVVAYCTGDDELGRYAKTLLLEHDGEVIVSFVTISDWKDSTGKFLGLENCQQYYNSTGEDGMARAIITGIRPAPMRLGAYRG